MKIGDGKANCSLQCNSWNALYPGNRDLERPVRKISSLCCSCRIFEHGHGITASNWQAKFADGLLGVVEYRAARPPVRSRHAYQVSRDRPNIVVWLRMASAKGDDSCIRHAEPDNDVGPIP